MTKRAQQLLRTKKPFDSFVKTSCVKKYINKSVFCFFLSFHSSAKDFKFRAWLVPLGWMFLL